MKLIPIPLSTGKILDALKSYELEKGLRFYQHRQSTPSYLDSSKNPTKPPFRRIEDRLIKFL